MKIAVFCPKDLPHSSRIYMEDITAELAKMGETVIPFSGRELLQGVDLYWQPSTGRNGPSDVFKKAEAPVVVTFHGAANLVLPLWKCFKPGLKNQLNGFKSRLNTFRDWRCRYRFWDAVITVSEYAKQEAHQYLKIPYNIITSIYHGVDHEVFYPADINPPDFNPDQNWKPYFLHISSYQPKKNLERMITAYFQISKHLRPKFIIVAPGYDLSEPKEGIELIRQPMNHRQIANLYQNALGFIFPSLHETFGMPIIEAMASGCPVITSNHPGCLEIAGGAALIVNPYSVEEITNIMKRLIVDLDLRKTLQCKGIAHASQFTWQKSAVLHLKVFREVIENKFPQISCR